MPTTVLHTAEASKAIYKNKDFEGYTLLGGFFDPKNNNRLGWKKKDDAGGGSAGFYKNDNGTDEYILAFRGSKGHKDWLVDDRQIAGTYSADRAHDCIQYAWNIRTAHPRAQIIVTGHSLGGYLAQVIGAICGLPFISYNAPAAGASFPGDPQIMETCDEGLNIRVEWDPVSRMVSGKHIGPIVQLPHYGINILNAHTGAAFLKSVEKSNFKDQRAIDFIRLKNRTARGAM